MAETPAAEKHIYSDGRIEWRTKAGVWHRQDGPALIFPGGREEWRFRGQLHRRDGPAVYDKSSKSTKIWWFEGYCYTFDKWCEMTRKTKEEKLLLQLEYL